MELILFLEKRINSKKLQQELKGKTILITGASFGIGEELAYMLAMKEIELIIVGRTKDKLELVKEKVEKLGGVAEVYCADLRIEKQIDGLIEYLKNRKRGVDVFVSNAGKSIKRSIFKSLDRYHDFTRTMEINYYAPVKLCLALIPILEKRQGHILNISAINVLFLPMPEWSAYQSSKTAFDQWLKSVSPELNAKNIATSTLYLPLVKTRMIEPTKMYKNMPAMKPKHVARIICSMIMNRKSIYKPWWAIFAEIGSFLLRRPVMFFVNYKYRKNA